ncbi:MAG: hypothetical protein ACRDYU_01220 [Actinomycetes bacterium]
MSDPQDRDPWAPPAEDDPGASSRAPGSHAPVSQDEEPSRTAGSAPVRTAYGTPQQDRARGRPPGQGLLLLAVLALVTAFVIPPVGFALCAVVIVLALRARRTAAAAGGTAPGTIGAIAVSVTGLVLPLVVLGVFYDQITRYSECVQAANTHEAQDDCNDMLEDMLADLRR